MRRLSPTALALATAGALLGSLLAVSPASATTTTGASGHGSSGADGSDLALKASGYGSRVIGGQVPANSGRTAFTAIGCATRPGIERENHTVATAIPGLGKVSAIRTRLWTTRSGGVVTSHSRNTIGEVVLAQSGLGTLQLAAITSYSRAYHDGRGFHAEATASLGGLEFVPPGGKPQKLDLPLPGKPIEIPGLAKITLGKSYERATSRGAAAQADALVVDVTATGAKVTLGHSGARVFKGAKYGTFHGFSAGTQARGLADNVSSGRTPLSLMPCQGTNGKVQTTKTAGVDLGGNLEISGLQSKQMGKQLAGRSVAFERGSIAGVDLGDGALVIDGLVARAQVVRRGGKVTTSTKGTTLGRITVDGKPFELPDTGVVEIPGVAKLEPKVVVPLRGGVSVVALRLTLLDGTGAVIDLGLAKAAIYRR